MRSRKIQKLVVYLMLFAMLANTVSRGATGSVETGYSMLSGEVFAGISSPQSIISRSDWVAHADGNVRAAHCDVGEPS